MRRTTSIFLLAVLAATGSGFLGYLHLQEHLKEQRASSVRSSILATDDRHDESTCTLCMTLHMPAVAGGPTTLLIFLGLLVAVASEFARTYIPARAPLAIVCRGPPCR